MGAFNGASTFFKKPLVDIAKMLNYREDNILILEEKEIELKNKYPLTYANMQSCLHHRDERTPIKYAQDLVASWVVEDAFLHTFIKFGLTAKLGGADNNRQILSNAKTSSSSDFLITLDGKSRKLELMNDYTGYWIRTNKLHLRDNKYQKLNNETSLFLAISMSTNQFLLFDFKNKINAIYIPYHVPYGGKPAYELSLSNIDFHPSSSKQIIEKIVSTF